MKKQTVRNQHNGESYMWNLKRIIDIYDKWSPLGVSNENIYKLYIRPEFRFSLRTFNRYLKNAWRLDGYVFEELRITNYELRDNTQLKIFEDNEDNEDL